MLIILIWNFQTAKLQSLIVVRKFSILFFQFFLLCGKVSILLSTFGGVVFCGLHISSPNTFTTTVSVRVCGISILNANNATKSDTISPI